MQKNLYPNNDFDKGISFLNDLQNDMGRLSDLTDTTLTKSQSLIVIRKVWPGIFRVSEPKPLKIGIHNEMIEMNLIHPVIIKRALRYFVRQEKYLTALKEGCLRINTYGEPSGAVTLKEAIGAEIALYRMYQHQTLKSMSDNRVFLGECNLIKVLCSRPKVVEDEVNTNE